MSKEREILQKFQSGMSQRSIALGLHVSRNTVAKVIAAYKSSNISQELLNTIDDDELHRKLYPDEVPSVPAQMPDSPEEIRGAEQKSIPRAALFRKRFHKRFFLVSCPCPVIE